MYKQLFNLDLDPFAKAWPRLNVSAAVGHESIIKLFNRLDIGTGVFYMYGGFLKGVKTPVFAYKPTSSSLFIVSHEQIAVCSYEEVPESRDQLVFDICVESKGEQLCKALYECLTPEFFKGNYRV